MRRLAAAFGLFVIAIIIAADQGRLGFLRRIQDLPLGDKLGHFGLYGALSLCVALAVFEWRPAWPRLRAALASGLVLAAAAAVEEISQLYFPARTFSGWDLAASVAGILAGAVSAYELDRQRRGRARL